MAKDKTNPADPQPQPVPDDAQPSGDAPANPNPPAAAAPANEPAKNVYKPEDTKVIGNWPKDLPGHPPKR